MLAWPYGYPKIMSSYNFDNSDQGPPSDAYGNTKPVYNADGSMNCFGSEWKCEHRWQPIANMVQFRNETASAFSVNNWWDNGNNQIAFGRGDKGFVVINKESYTLNRTFQTGMPAGTYCNVIKGNLLTDGSGCTGSSVTVNANGTATVSVNAWDALAIHAGAKVNGGGGGTVAVTFKENATTYWGQNVYVVGNVAELGGWNTGQAILLSPANYPIWSGTVNLPANTLIEYKYIKKDGSNVVWESGSNRVFTTPGSGTLTRNDTWK